MGARRGLGMVRYTQRAASYSARGQPSTSYPVLMSYRPQKLIIMGTCICDLNLTSQSKTAAFTKEISLSAGSLVNP